MVNFLILIEVASAILLSLSGLGLSKVAALHGDAGYPRSLAQPPGAVRFAVIGDFGGGGQPEADVASLVASWNPDFVVTVGDNRYGATNYDTVIGQFYCQYLKDAGSGTHCAGGSAASNNFLPALGNHDYSAGGGIGEYLNYFTLPGAGSANSSGNERYYDLVRGPVHLFFVNSNSQEPDGRNSASAQAMWLQAQLAASTAPWKLVVLHHAPYSSAEHGSQPVMQWPYAGWGASAVLAGHDHTYERLLVDGLPYFVNGLGGNDIYDFNTPLPDSQVRYNANYGAMLVQANDSALTFEFVNRMGVLVDSYTINRPPLATGLASFTVASHGGSLLVSWETVDETNNTGFNLYRANSAAGAQTLLAYVPSQSPGSTQGFAYTYDDLAVQPGQTYWYWLEAVSLTGVKTLHGPLSVTVSEPAAVTLASLQAMPAAPTNPAVAAGLAGLAGLVAAAGVAVRRRLQR